jgi:hypothetical protein
MTVSASSLCFPVYRPNSKTSTRAEVGLTYCGLQGLKCGPEAGSGPSPPPRPPELEPLGLARSAQSLAAEVTQKLSLSSSDHCVKLEQCLHVYVVILEAREADSGWEQSRQRRPQSLR